MNENFTTEEKINEKAEPTMTKKQMADSFADSLVYVITRKSTYLIGIILSILPYKLIDLIFGDSSVKTPIAIVVVVAVFLAVIILRTRARMAKHPTPEMQSFKLHK